ncbi:hypothetical protein BJ138DRAFT_1146382 [Hygrophoropsis aurantiaca]|uniref:Uncharacterized protein n=1 Tax=Hygrophoropsis aurantiaca TaxID=72124 RepID=A0ACB8AK35_9AGAM|nr:hypothetical protein BJ138DRAFT_1146382 [Hygrophoropsis aurantiaca]
MPTISSDNILTLCHPRSSSGQNPNQAVIVSSPAYLVDDIPQDHVLIKVDRFGFSANNITYQALGEAPHFRYFDFHLAPKAGKISAEQYGVTPVWGFGTVLRSTHAKISSGERVYGYFAPTQYLLLPVSPADVNKFAFFVPRPHLPADRRPYNQVTRCQSDPLYDPSPVAEDLTMLYRPLFWTSFWCEDWLNSTDYRHGASRILISSASSKTAFCLAYLIRKRISQASNSAAQMRKIVGLTSKKNLAFTQRLGLYDDILEYETFASSSAMRLAEQKWIYVDVAGNDSLNAQIFAYFESKSDKRRHLVACIALGFTNLSPAAEPAASLTKWSKNDFSTNSTRSDTDNTVKVIPDVEQFFMPEWLAVRRYQLSVAEITRLQKDAWTNLMKDCLGWGVHLRRVYGPDQVKKAYENVVASGIPPQEGFIWSLWDEASEREQAKSRL